MTEQELTRMINDPTISDERVFEATKEYIANDPNEKLETIPTDAQLTQRLEAFERLSILTIAVRPRVMELLNKLVAEQHEGCCSNSS